MSYLMDLWHYMKLLMHEYSDIFHLGYSLFIHLSKLVINGSSGFHMFFMIVGTDFLAMEHLELNASFTSGLLCLTHLIACNLWSISPPLLRPHALFWGQLSMQTAGGTWEFSFPVGQLLAYDWPVCESPDVLTQQEFTPSQASPCRISTN